MAMARINHETGVIGNRKSQIEWSIPILHFSSVQIEGMADTRYLMRNATIIAQADNKETGIIKLSVNPKARLGTHAVIVTST